MCSLFPFIGTLASGVLYAFEFIQHNTPEACVPIP